jgi:hypothetical protein
MMGFACLLVFSCSSSPSNDPIDGDLDSDTDEQDGDLDTSEGDIDDEASVPMATIELLSFPLPAAEELNPGEIFEEPAYIYQSMPLSQQYPHVLNFMVTPMLPPWRKPLRTPGPLILFDDDFHTLVVSPVDYPFASLVWMEDDTLYLGLSGEVSDIDTTKPHRFIKAEGEGLNATVAGWGEAIRELTGREATDRYADIGLAYLGYWTDNGAYYYYKTEAGMNEEETLMAVVDEARQLKVPYGYIQLDSWWYFKKNQDGLSPGGLIRWEPRPEMFPDGLKTFRQRVGLPLILHNRWLAEENDYLADYDFLPGDGMLLPDGRPLYDHFMENASDWGAITYEQDWLVAQFWGVPSLRQTLTGGPGWMQAMDDAANDAGLTMQLCMAGAPHLLDSIKRKRSTSIRTSIDYAADVCKECYWPQFHIVNMISTALGLLPFKDNFRSSESQGEAESLISSLSAGMVGIGDGLGLTVTQTVMRTCRADGLLLKPDRPALPIDGMFIKHERPFITSTYSKRSDASAKWTYIAAYHLARLHPDRSSMDKLWAGIQYDGKDLGDWNLDLERDFGIRRQHVLFDWRTRQARVVDGITEFDPFENLFDFAYLVAVPIFDNGLALIGEVDKFVTLADRRFSKIEVTEDGFNITLAGSKGERVALWIYDALTEKLWPPSTVEIKEDGTAQASLRRP